MATTAASRPGDGFVESSASTRRPFGTGAKWDGIAVDRLLFDSVFFASEDSDVMRRFGAFSNRPLTTRFIRVGQACFLRPQADKPFH